YRGCACLIEGGNQLDKRFWDAKHPRSVIARGLINDLKRRACILLRRILGQQCPETRELDGVDALRVNPRPLPETVRVARHVSGLRGIGDHDVSQDAHESTSIWTLLDNPARASQCAYRATTTRAGAPPRS